MRIGAGSPIAILLLMGLAKAARNLLEKVRDAPQGGVVRHERWVMKSCGVGTTYEVLLTPARRGGTDIIVQAVAHDTTAQKP